MAELCTDDFAYYPDLHIEPLNLQGFIDMESANMSPTNEYDMQLKFNTYSQLNQQLQAAIAKLQEKTPAFTTLKGAAVPIKPAGPKRMIFVLSMVCVAFVIGTLWTLRKDIPKLFV